MLRPYFASRHLHRRSQKLKLFDQSSLSTPTLDENAVEDSVEDSKTSGNPIGSEFPQDDSSLDEKKTSPKNSSTIVSFTVLRPIRKPKFANEKAKLCWKFNREHSLTPEIASIIYRLKFKDNMFEWKQYEANSGSINAIDFQGQVYELHNEREIAKKILFLYTFILSTRYPRLRRYSDIRSCLIVMCVDLKRACWKTIELLQVYMHKAERVLLMDVSDVSQDLMSSVMEKYQEPLPFLFRYSS